MQQPPFIDGIMVNIPCVKSDLELIKTGFLPTDLEPQVSTFYIVATWNQAHPTTPINGDTAEFLLR